MCLDCPWMATRSRLSEVYKVSAGRPSHQWWNGTLLLVQWTALRTLLVSWGHCHTEESQIIPRNGYSHTRAWYWGHCHTEESQIIPRNGYSHTWAWYWGHCHTEESQIIPGMGTPILGHGSEVLRWWPHIFNFQSAWVPILGLIVIWLTLSFCRKNWFVSITFSSRDTWI